MVIIILTILFAHFFGDMVVQPRKYAVNKWHSNKALFGHVAIYTLCLFLWTGMILVPMIGQQTMIYFAVWSLINGVYHFIVDYVTARLMRKAQFQKDKKMFFVYLGIDQFLHHSILAITFIILMAVIIFT
jgi:hypothetical protein